MEKSYNIIGDIHGRTCWKELVKDDCVNIFVGDYFDPYDKISHDELMQNFADIIAFKKQHPDTVLLYGNHDLHYLIPQEHASRYSILHSRAYKQAFADTAELFNGLLTLLQRLFLLRMREYQRSGMRKSLVRTRVRLFLRWQMTSMTFGNIIR